MDDDKTNPSDDDADTDEKEVKEETNTEETE